MGNQRKVTMPLTLCPRAGACRAGALTKPAGGMAVDVGRARGRAVALGAAVRVGAAVFAGAIVRVGVAVSVGAIVRVGVAVLVGAIVRVGDGVGVGAIVRVGDGVGVGATVHVWEAVAIALGRGVAVSVIPVATAAGRMDVTAVENGKDRDTGDPVGVAAGGDAVARLAWNAGNSMAPLPAAMPDMVRPNTYVSNAIRSRTNATTRTTRRVCGASRLRRRRPRCGFSPESRRWVAAREGGWER